MKVSMVSNYGNYSPNNAITFGNNATRKIEEFNSAADEVKNVISTSSDECQKALMTLKADDKKNPLTCLFSVATIALSMLAAYKVFFKVADKLLFSGKGSKAAADKLTQFLSTQGKQAIKTVETKNPKIASYLSKVGSFGSKIAKNLEPSALLAVIPAVPTTLYTLSVDGNEDGIKDFKQKSYSCIEGINNLQGSLGTLEPVLKLLS